ncbi:MAG TPA: arginine N-succinyltransferase [Dokdonella sp.]|jgi:arginine N-succinyltransferase|nr:arginine N-succinyltransferase [Dokdonella sp.]
MSIWHLHRIPDPVEAAASDTLLAFDALSAPGSASIRLGTLRLRRRIGMTLPRYWYHVGEVVHSAPTLDLFRREKVLLLGNDFTAASELADIRVDAADGPPARCTEILEIMIRAALLLLDTTAGGKDEPIEDELRTIVELPGVRTGNGAFPFWEGLGRFFHDANPDDGEREYGPAWRSHVAALLPRHPVVVSLLRSSARTAIGEVGESATALRDALLAQGFGPSRHVGIIDGGPVYCSEARFRQAARTCELVPEVAEPKAETAPSWLLRPDHREEVWCLPGHDHGGGIALAADALERCGLATGGAAAVLPWTRRE